MASVFFTRDGQSLEQAFFAGNLSDSDAAGHFGTYEKHYSPDMPIIGEITHLTGFTDYRHVIVRIDKEEICSAFPKAGYYIINNLTISSAKSMMGLAS